LAERFEYSLPTARRTINSLRDDFYAPLEFDRKANTWRLTDPTWEMPHLTLSPDELSAVALARSLVSKITAPSIAEPMERFWDKLCLDLAQQSPAGAGFAHAVSARAPAWARVPTEIIEPCLRSLALDRRLDITYRSPWRGDVTRRTIEPRHLLFYDGSYYLAAHCLLKKGDLRLFNLRAITSVALTDTSCSHTDFRIDDIIDSYGLMLGGEKTTVRLRIRAPRGARAAIETWHPDQVDHTDPDGTLTRSFPVRGLAEVHRLVLSYGASVEVLEPAELREQIEEEIKQMAAQLDRPPTGGREKTGRKAKKHQKKPKRPKKGEV
jgi:predicted DNA-binding transcriptional regulator YafY